MKKKLTLVLTSVIAAAALASCSKGNESSRLIIDENNMNDFIYGDPFIPPPTPQAPTRPARARRPMCPAPR